MSSWRDLQFQYRSANSWPCGLVANKSGVSTNSQATLQVRLSFQGLTLLAHHANGTSAYLPRTVCGAPDLPGAGQSSSFRSHPPSSSIPNMDASEKLLPGREMGASVGGDQVPLLYTPYMDYLWQRLVEMVPGLHMCPLPTELRQQRNRKGAKPARCCNWLLAGERLRRIRFTYFEAGEAGQAFNCLLYPDPRFDLPLLGIDLISLGANKILCVIDFLPLVQDPVYLEKHTHQLVPIRNRFIKHCGRMSARYFDENKFFSKQLIFYRSDGGVEDPMLKVPQGDLFVVYAGFVEEYLKALSAAVPEVDEQRLQFVKGRQDAYDRYNAERDPALRLFATYFGAEWTKTCTEDFLFPGAYAGGGSS